MTEKPNKRLGDYISDANVEILIVEDSHTQAAQLKHVLETNRYIVTLAYDGEEALELLGKRRPSIVISDVVMPGMDGYELCRKLKQNELTKSIPMILLTSLSNPHDIIKGLECGADHFITKPYNKDYLLSHIQYIFVNRELRKQSMADLGIEIFFAGQRHFLTSDRIQILDLLFSTYEVVMQKNRELEQANLKLTRSLETIKTLGGLIPICSECKKIRNDKGYWQQLEIYIKEHSDAEFTHGLCPDCEKNIYSKYIKQGDSKPKPEKRMSEK